MTAHVASVILMHFIVQRLDKCGNIVEYLRSLYFDKGAGQYFTHHRQFS